MRRQELGHSQTLLHFTEGTAASWGIGAQYPQDGTHVATHPWGYDGTRRKLRTWYRVDANGPVYQDVDAAELQGKRDPMNGGESALSDADGNVLTCYPPVRRRPPRRLCSVHAARPDALFARCDG